MGINFAGLGAGYEGFNANQDNQAQQDRLAAAEQRAEQDQDFVEYQRNIAKTNRDKNLADAADIKAKYDAQQQSQNQGQQSTDSGSADQSNQGATPSPLFKVGGLKTSVPVNVVSPQSATDGGNQSAQPAQPAQSTDAASQAPQSTPAQPAQDQGQDPNVTAAIPIAVPDPRSPTATVSATDQGSGQPATSSQPATPANADGTATSSPSTVAPDATTPTTRSAAAPQLPASGGLATAAQAAPSQSIVNQANGIPQPSNFNSTLDQQLELLNRQSMDGRISPPEYAAAVRNINMLKQEGVHAAIDLMAQGQYQEALDRFNSVGSYRDARFIKAQDGDTLINGVSQPTKLVTLAGRNGPITIDTTQAQYQLLSADQRMALADKAASTKMMDEHYQRDDAFHMKQADTMEGYRKNQDDNMREQRILEERKIAAMGNPQAPTWNDKDDAYLQKIYTQPDPTTGVMTLDPSGASFARKVAQAQARINGGDTMSGIDYAYSIDAKLRKAAGDDPEKLAQLRASALQRLPQQQPITSRNSGNGSSSAQSSAPAPAPTPNAPPLSGKDPDAPYYKDANGNPTGDQQGLDSPSRDLIMAWNPPNAEGMQEKQAMLAQINRQVASDKQAAANPAPLLTTRGGVNIAEQNQKIALMNKLSGADLTRRANVIQAATDNVNKNLPDQLALIKPGASRADRLNFSNWFDANSGYMTNTQLRQIRMARQAAGW